MERSALAMLIAVTVACTVAPGSGEGDSTGGSDASSTAVDGSSSADTELPSCPGGTSSTALAVDAARPDDANEEGDAIVNAGPCTIESSGGDAQSGWVLALRCDLNGLEPATPVELRITQEHSAFVGLDLAQPVELTLDRWWGFEAGSGTAVRLEQGGQLIVASTSEARGGGLVHVCALPDDDARVAADAWLAAIDAHLEAGACDPDGTLRVVRAVDGDDVFAYPGEATALGDLQIVVADARCAVQGDGGPEDWSFRLTAWRE
ncbi:MAG: hypothetical protein IPK74_09825 [Deltaproteobacteria bacterium]|nr:hypothetical protein [Deltaproteobacteria bacterium]